MNRTFWAGLLSLALSFSASAALYTYNFESGFQNGGIVPDGSADGWTDTRTISVIDTVMEDVNISFTLSGGANGDLRAYLSHGGVLVPLLNRVGTGSGDTVQQNFGFSTAGFSNVRLDDAGSGGSIHDVAVPGSATTISYTPDGGSLSAFNGQNPSGTWTLFFADMANEGGTGPSVMGNWSLEITAVPESVNVALGGFAGVFTLVAISRTRVVRRRIRRWYGAFNDWVDAV